jgi:glycine hydroxymethyltransferase
VAFEEDLRPGYRVYCQRILRNTKTLAHALTDFGYTLVSGGTDNHLMLLDLHPHGITGLEAERALEAAGITVNKNMVPFDTQSPFVTSGIRIGTPAVTTRGMNENDMKTIAGFIHRVLSNRSDADSLKRVRTEVREFCRPFPLHSEDPGSSAEQHP